MVRLQPYNYERFVQADHLEFSFGGGEANVAVSLANYGLDAVYVTKLPAHAIGQAAVNSLRRYSVDATVSVSPIMRKARLSAVPFAFMTGRILPFRSPLPPTSTGM